jgi:cysteinyl-tRNA synthetase
MSSLQIYNSLTRKKEIFQSLEPNKVKMYCCGPTVYDLLHVGNFRGAVFYNLVRNWFEYLGYQVKFVYNYTDVDDKIIKRANEEKVDSLVISERFITEFEKDFNSLGLQKHDLNPKVTEHMPQIIKFVEDLISNGKAYVVNGEVLYSIKSFPEYGKLSGRNPEELQAGARVEVDDKKRDPLDFTLWKPSKSGEPSWDSPWGKGRPGWHIECSAMVRSIHGDQIDIHGGGSDLIFPHHENEIAQSEGCTHKTLAKYWLHNNMFTFSGQKMSKSLGNIWRARDFFNEYHPEIYKYMVISVHYRTLAEFSEQTANFAISALGRVYSSLALADIYISNKELQNIEIKSDGKYEAYLAEQWKKVEESLNDDFSTPEAFSALFEVIREFNGKVKRGLKLNLQLENICLQFSKWVKKFGLLVTLFQEIPHNFLKELDDRLLAQKDLKREQVDKIVNDRVVARKAKDFVKSDELRNELNKMGIAVSDTPEGSYWEVAK